MGKLELMRRRTKDGAVPCSERQRRTTPTMLALGLIVLFGLTAAACGRPSPDTAQGDTDNTGDAATQEGVATEEGAMAEETAGPAMDAGEISDPSQTGQVVTGRAGVRIVSDGPILTPLPPTTPPTTAVPQSQLYEVQPGDTLSVIAERFSITTTALADANGITDVNTIKPGQELTIPPPAP